MTRSASQIVYAACGSPDPTDSAWRPIPRRGSGGPCAACGLPGRYRMSDAISDSFTSVKNSARMFPHRGTEACAACVFACKTLRLRCAAWIATEEAIWFQPRFGDWGGLLDALLSPPDPPFVAAYPKTGIDKGGQSNMERTWWPGLPCPGRPLTRLQSKHVAIYARVAHSRERYPLQVDDQHDVTVDVPLWSELRRQCESLRVDFSDASATAFRRSLLTLLPPPHSTVAQSMIWHSSTAPFIPFFRSLWWPTFVEILPVKGATNAKT